MDIFILVSHFSFSFSLSLTDGSILTEILSQRAVKIKTTNQMITDRLVPAVHGVGRVVRWLVGWLVVLGLTAL